MVERRVVAIHLLRIPVPIDCVGMAQRVVDDGGLAVWVLLPKVVSLDVLPSVLKLTYEVRTRSDFISFE